MTENLTRALISTDYVDDTGLTVTDGTKVGKQESERETVTDRMRFLRETERDRYYQIQKELYFIRAVL